MARISKYQNNTSPFSETLIHQIRDNALKITLETVEKYQVEYGISDKMLAALIGADNAAISRWKSGKQVLSDNNLIALFFAMAHFEQHL